MSSLSSRFTQYRFADYEFNVTTGNCDVINQCLINNGGCEDRCENDGGAVECFCDDPGSV